MYGYPPPPLHARRLCTWLSSDGGVTWAEVGAGAYIYEYADWGGLVVMARHPGERARGLGVGVWGGGLGSGGVERVLGGARRSTHAGGQCPRVPARVLVLMSLLMCWCRVVAGVDPSAPAAAADEIRFSLDYGRCWQVGACVRVCVCAWGGGGGDGRG